MARIHFPECALSVGGSHFARIQSASLDIDRPAQVEHYLSAYGPSRPNFIQGDEVRLRLEGLVLSQATLGQFNFADDPDKAAAAPMLNGSYSTPSLVLGLDTKQVTFTSCYLNSYSMTARVRDVVRQSLGFEGNELALSTGGVSNPLTDTSPVLRHSDVTITVPQGVGELDSGVSTATVPIQECSVQVSIPWEPQYAIGSLTPRRRVLSGDILCSVRFTTMPITLQDYTAPSSWVDANTYTIAITLERGANTSLFTIYQAVAVRDSFSVSVSDTAAIITAEYQAYCHGPEAEAGLWISTPE